MKNLVLPFLLLFSLHLLAQSNYTQSGVIHTEVQLYTKDGVQINGNSKEMHIEYPENGTKMLITLDPHTLVTDNIDFNKQMDNSLLGNFEFVAEIDASSFEFQSRYNEALAVEAESRINNIDGQVAINMVISNQKNNNQNTYIIVGKGELDIEEYELNEIFPDLDGVLKFQFTQNLRVRYN